MNNEGKLKKRLIPLLWKNPALKRCGILHIKAEELIESLPNPPLRSGIAAM
jgi:hypothetical protein